MKHFVIYYSNYADYIADSEEEAITMFKNDHYFSDLTMNIKVVEEEEIEEDD